MNKKNIWRFIEIVLVLILVISGYKIFKYWQHTQRFEAENIAYRQMVAEKKADDERKEDKEEENRASRDLITSLRKEFPSVIARIVIEGTQIDFPVVQGADNDYYLDHTYKGDYHPFGAVFMDMANQSNFRDANTVLYGHNVRSGHVFHDLEQFQDESFVKKHPTIALDTLSGKKTYRIVAVYNTSARDNYRQPDYSEKDWAMFMARIDEKNLLPYKMPKEKTPILTLSTCSDVDERLVLHAIETLGNEKK